MAAGVAASQRTRQRLRVAKAWGTSPSIFDGRPLTEVHEHFDAEGIKTGWTRVTREPLWNDDDRDRALALDEYERSICPCGCGLPIAEAHNPETGFIVDEHICYARKAINGTRRQLEAKAEKDKAPAGWDDGKFWFIKDTYTETESEGGARG